MSPNVDPKGFLDRSRPDLYLIHADLESGLDVRATKRFIDGGALHAPKWIVHRTRSMSLNFASVVAREGLDINSNIFYLHPNEQAKYQFVHADELESLERKQRATEKLSELIARHDYVLLDVNAELELVRRFANLVAVVVDTNCSMAVRSAGRFVSALKNIKCRETTPSYFGLLTNCDVGGISSELEEFVGNFVKLSDEQYRDIVDSKYSTCRRRERVLELVDSLEFPPLHTELTGAYRIAIEMLEDAPPPGTGIRVFQRIRRFRTARSCRSRDASPGR